MVLCFASASTDSGLRAVRQVNTERMRICLPFNMSEDQTTATLRWSSPAEQRQLQGDLALAYHKNLSVDTLFFVDHSDRLSWSWLLWRDGVKQGAVCLVSVSTSVVAILCVYAWVLVHVYRGQISALGVVCLVWEILFYGRVSYRPRTH